MMTIRDIFNELKPFIKKIRNSLFNVIKNTSFYLLRKLNSDFDLSWVNSRNTQNIEQGTNQVKAGVSIKSAVIINNDQALLNQEVLDFYLRGIFPEESAFNHVRNTYCNNMVGLNFEEIDKKLESQLLHNLTEKKDGFSALMCQAFFAHKEKKVSNENAYSTKDKLNPNAVFWPDPTDSKHKRSLYTELPFANQIPLIDKSTKIVSAGSCFATEIAHLLQRTGYNYLIKEQNKSVEGSYEFLDSTELPNSSAAWGTIFNTPSFRQLVEKAFEVRELPRILWTNQHNGKLRYLDPFRENIAFVSPEAYEENYNSHIKAAREAFLEMDIFIITLGLNEVWYFKADGSVFSRSPWRTAPSLVAHKVMSVEENVNDLMLMAQILRAHNPNVSIICTLSPIALHATFRANEQHIVTANAHSKSVLRVAAEEFTKRCKNAYYFPSYEVVTVSTEHPWKANQRHVSKDGVDNVIKLFHQIYSK